MRPMMRRLALRAAFAAVFAAGAGGVEAGGPTATSYLTNVELMQAVARGVITQGMQRVPELGAKTIGVRSIQPSEVDWIVETEILSALSRQGIAVHAADMPVATGGGKRASTGTGKPVLDFPVDVPPKFMSGDPVPYPPSACGKGAAGRVDVTLVINEQGSVANVVFDESTGEDFQSAVEAGVAKYRFTPAVKEKESAPGTYKLRFDFPAVEEGCEEAVSVGAPPPAAKAEEEESGPAPVASLSAASDAPVTLAYRVSEVELRYPTAERRFWLGRKRVERYARLRVDLRVRRGEDILWAESVEHYASDKVPMSALRYLENEQYSFAKPELPHGAAGRFVEPLVVAGVIGGLVLLFYANQTGN